ncbi:MAG: hypothetical protein Q6354_09560 [Candidatus Brocadiales bacterium]|nr:hypothetical protein [Candidatus Brocadiales bacterium]
MRFFMIFVVGMLVCTSAYGEKNLTNEPLLRQQAATSIQQRTHKEQLEKQLEIVTLVSDVVNGKATVRPSMVPPEIFDRIYFAEKQNQKLLAAFRERFSKLSAKEFGSAEWIFYLGQLTAMRDLLYIVGVLPESFYSSNAGFGNFALETLTSSSVGLAIDRMRLVTTMLLLLNYKELTPIPPGDIVQVVLDAPGLEKRK